LRCATIDELIETAGHALSLPIPTAAERAIVRDVIEEKADWVRIATELFGK
jgi:predicted metal-dependent hydrolase